MAFHEGEECPVGPRNSTVVFECGPEDKLLSVSEPSVCVYEGLFSTPSVCQPADLRKKHEELLEAAAAAGLTYEIGQTTKEILADGWQ